MRKVRETFKEYFIPQEGNGNKPRILSPRNIAFFCMIVLVAEAAFVFGIRYGIPQSKLYGIIDANVLVDETNQNRTENNLPALTVSPLLQAAAQEKANDEATKDYFAHTSPQGLTPWYWFENVGYNFDYAGENLAVNFTDSQDVTAAWMNSPEHRANILSTDFTQIGIATAQGVYNGQEATYVVEEFGTPAPAAAPVAFVNTAAAATVPTTGPISPDVTPAPATTTVTATKNSTTVSVPASAPAKKPATTPAPAPKPAGVIPSIVTIASSTSSSSNETFVAVQGASIALNQTTTSATSTSVAQSAANAPSVSPTNPAGSTAVALPAPQGSFIQRLFANPKMVADDFYIVVMALFLLALILNIFINIQVQYPRLIAGGLIVIVIAGLCVLLNQNIGLLHAVIL
jgi:Cysteine-rich secretory protein family